MSAALTGFFVGAVLVGLMGFFAGWLLGNYEAECRGDPRPPPRRPRADDDAWWKGGRE